jgi:hypothetical protein
VKPPAWGQRPQSPFFQLIMSTYLGMYKIAVSAYREVAAMRLAHPLLTTWSCLTEVIYLSLHWGGWTMQKQLGRLLLGACSRNGALAP